MSSGAPRSSAPILVFFDNCDEPRAACGFIASIDGAALDLDVVKSEAGYGPRRERIDESEAVPAPDLLDLLVQDLVNSAVNRACPGETRTLSRCSALRSPCGR